MAGETGEKIGSTTESPQGQTESVEASGDAFVIADAIYGGFELIAAALDRLTKSMEGDSVDDDSQGEFYLDGSRVR